VGQTHLILQEGTALPPDQPAPDNPPLWKQRETDPVRGHILFAFGVMLALALAWRLRDVVLLVYVSALAAVVLMPAVNGIMRFNLRGGGHLSRGAAILLLISGVILSLTLIFGLGLPPVIHDLRQFAHDLPDRIPVIVAKVKHIPYADRFGVDAIAGKAQSALSATAGYLFASFPNWMSEFTKLLAALVLCVYFMLEGEHAYIWFMSLFSVENRLRLAVTLEKADVRLSRWLLGQGLLMLILGVTSTIVFGLLHVRYFVLLGVLMGLFNIVPIAGALITVSLAALVAALDSWTKMAGVLIFYTIYVNLENAVLTPRIMRSSVNLMGLTVLISLLAGAELAGIVGTLIAVPTAALIAVLMDEYLVQKDQTGPPPSA
jgi:predicted PurR-regulated permease PerM